MIGPDKTNGGIRDTYVALVKSHIQFINKLLPYLFFRPSSEIKGGVKRVSR